MSPSLPSFVSLFNLLVSAVMCWSVVFRRVCVMVTATVLCLPACLPACLFFPFGVVLVHFCFILLLKRQILLHLSPRLISLSSRTLTERISQLRTQQRMKPVNMGPAGKFLDIRQGLRQGLHGNGLPVSYREDLPHGHLLGRPGRPL